MDPTIPARPSQAYSSSNEVAPLIEEVRRLRQQQSEVTPNGEAEKKPPHRIRRDDLKLICYEYVYA